MIFDQELQQTAGSDTIFLQIYVDAPPGVSKIRIFTNETVEFLS